MTEKFNKWLNGWQEHNNEIQRFINHSQPKPINLPADDEPYGDIVYVPHDCVLPDPKQHKIGTVFRCRAYYQPGSACQDFWELQSIRDHVFWVRVRPRWHNQ
jgi:hypothetical protein